MGWPAGLSICIILSRWRRKCNAARNSQPSKPKPGPRQLVAASEASYHLHSLITQSRQPSVADPVPHPHPHLSPKPEETVLQLRTHSQDAVTTGLAPALLTPTVPHSLADPPSIHALHTQTVTHPDAADSELTKALRELQLEQAQQQQQQPFAAQSHPMAGALHAQSMAAPPLQSAAQFDGQTQEPAPIFRSQPIVQDARPRPPSEKENICAQIACTQQQQKLGLGRQQSELLLPVVKQAVLADGHAQLGSQGSRRSAGKPAVTVLGVQARATGLGSLTEAQVVVLLHCTNDGAACALSNIKFDGTLAELTNALTSALTSKASYTLQRLC